LQVAVCVFCFEGVAKVGDRCAIGKFNHVNHSAHKWPKLRVNELEPNRTGDHLEKTTVGPTGLVESGGKAG
jgi:hypothetical protein